MINIKKDVVALIKGLFTKSTSPITNLEFSIPLKEPFIPAAPVTIAIKIDKMIRVSQFIDTWKSMILSAGKAALNSPTRICKGHAFARTVLD